MPPLDPDFQSRSRPKKEEVDDVISGMRSTSTVFVWVDVRRSLEGGVKWWRSENGVVLTEGIGEPKMLGFEWFGWVERRGSGKILFGEKVESGEVREMERRMDRLSVGLGEGEGVEKDEVEGGQAPRVVEDGKKVLREKVAIGNETLGPAAAVKDHWDD